MLKTRFSSEWIFKIFSHSFLLILVIFLPLCSSATWPRTRSFVTVTWSGWRITCAPTPLRPAELAAPALAALQTNVLDKSRARSSAALVGWCPSLHPAACLYEVSSSFFYLTVQTGFVVSVPPCWLHWEWLLSLISSLASTVIIPEKVSSRLFLCQSDAPHSFYTLQNIWLAKI